MRKFLIFIWLLVPLGAAAYHFGPGQQSIKIDQAATHIGLAEKHLINQEFAEAVIEFDEAISLLPKENISTNNTFLEDNTEDETNSELTIIEDNENNIVFIT